jgi:hypothetical protein
MDKINDGGPREIAPVPERTPMDVFENAIRAVGVVAACEWFGYAPDSQFTRITIATLIERSNNARGEA